MQKFLIKCLEFHTADEFVNGLSDVYLGPETGQWFSKYGIVCSEMSGKRNKRVIGSGRKTVKIDRMEK